MCLTPNYLNNHQPRDARTLDASFIWEFEGGNVEFPNKLNTPAQFSRVRELIEQPELLAAALDYIASENDDLNTEMHLKFIAVAAKLFEMSKESNANPKNIWYPGSK